jgi:hypothetical protein
MARQFNGKIALDIRDSTPDWDAFLDQKAPEDVPIISSPAPCTTSTHTTPRRASTPNCRTSRSVTGSTPDRSAQSRSAAR